MEIYQDTNLWNALCNQSVKPKKLVAQLNSKDTKLVLSSHTIFEIARTFRVPSRQAADRGRRLFAYLAEFADAHVLCARDIMDLLLAEIDALESRTGTVDAFIGSDGYHKLRAEIEKLANGDLDERAYNFINARDEFASNTRLNQARHFEGRPDMKGELKKVGEGDLYRWLQTETLTPTGVEILTAHIERVCNGIPRIEAAKFAGDLLVSASGRLARGIVRADLYYNWRCANRNSNPKDLIVDTYHVINSIYCDVYATGEGKQAKYAGLLLTRGTRVAVYDGTIPIDRWLLELN